MTPAAIAAILLCVVLGALAVFQLALVFGAPLGRFAWGGADRVLPRAKRIGSVISIVLYAVFAWVFLMKAELVPMVLPELVVDVGAWVIAAYFAIGIPMNAISRSKSERYTMTPVVALLTVLSVIVALG
ncbi:hypothetical protein [Agromyces ramosus]|uniref:Uncharacterized protein n=1 Tax=Agromyces ramosus TaxID=33879 RepID=A0ABU0R6L5_9MICO|nr:hypothetical protein [Agromyces ramosus]MDQ0893728.1 hypothetical protein [Agromyces ramosus]